MPNTTPAPIGADALRPIITWLDNGCDPKQAAEELRLLVQRADALASAAQPVAVPVKWWNGCDKTVPAALRYLADNERPSGGEARFNGAHLYQLADEIERMARLPLYTAPVPAAQGAGHA